jgi:hypothetical protein
MILPLVEVCTWYTMDAPQIRKRKAQSNSYPKQELSLQYPWHLSCCHQLNRFHDRELHSQTAHVCGLDSSSQGSGTAVHLPPAQPTAKVQLVVWVDCPMEPCSTEALALIARGFFLMNQNLPLCVYSLVFILYCENTDDGCYIFSGNPSTVLKLMNCKVIK